METQETEPVEQVEPATEPESPDNIEDFLAQVDANAEAEPGDPVEPEQANEEQSPAPAEGEPAEEPAGDNDELTIEEAKKLKELAQADPHAFLREHGADLLGPKFAALARSEKELRQREGEIKAAESRIKEAMSFREEFERDKLGFIRKHMDEETYRQITEHILDPSAATQASVNRQLAEMREQMQQQQQNFVAQQQSAQIEQGVRMYVDRATAHAQANHPYLLSIYSREQLQSELGQLVHGYQQNHNKGLTPEEALDILAEYTAGELQKSGFTAASTGDNREPTKQIPSGEADTGPRTLTNKLASEVTRAEQAEIYDLPDDEQLPALLARNS